MLLVVDDVVLVAVVVVATLLVDVARAVEVYPVVRVVVEVAS